VIELYSCRNVYW